MSTSLPLSRKIEQAFTSYLLSAQASGQIDSSVYIFPGRSATEPPVPWLCVSCTDPRPAPDVPPQTLIKEADLVLHLRTHADDESLATADARLSEVTHALGDLTALMSVLNAPATGTDTRPVQDIYFFEIFEGNQPDHPSENHWESQMIYNLTVQNGDPGKSY
jgi:hypothetical protein